MNPLPFSCRRCAGFALLCLPTLAAAQSTLPAVVVTATRTPQQIANVLSDLRVIDEAMLERAGPITLTELLQAHGGVEIAANGGAGQLSSVFVRGSNANHVVVLIDGVRVNSATAGSNAFENIPVSQIERVEILRGPASSLYGADAIGGVIQIFTKQHERTSARIGAGRWGTREASAGVGRTLGATTVSLQAGYHESDSFSATNAGAPAFFDPDDDSFRNKNIGLGVSHTWAPGQGLALRVLHSEVKAHFDDFGGSDAVNDMRISSVAVESRNTVTPIWRSVLRVAQGADHRTTVSAFPSKFDTDQNQATWQNDVSALGGQIAAGLEWRREKVSSSTAYDATSRSIKSAFGSYAAAIDAHLLQLSLRHDDNSQFGGHTTGNVGYGWRFTPALRLSASAGTAFKAPTFNDLYFPGFSNPNLEPEKSRSAEVALRYDEGPFTASVTAFENRIRNLIQFDFVSSAPINIAKARNRGITLGGSYTVQAWRAHAEITQQNPVDASTGDRLPRRAKTFASAGVALSEGPWRVSADLVASGERFDNAFAPPPPRLGGYALLHLHAAYALTPEWSASLRINNATDKRYEFVQGFNTPRRNAFVALEYAMR